MAIEDNMSNRELMLGDNQWPSADEDSHGRINGQTLGTIMMTTSVPVALGVAAVEKKILSNTNIVVPSSKPAYERQADIKVIDALSAGVTATALLLAGAIVAYRSRGRRSTLGR